MPGAVPERAEVVVVGGGVAGLACARRLRRQGVDVVVVEAAPTVGGRVRTEMIDGFRCDRGFQVFNPYYPEARRVLDITRLRVQPFPAGVVVGLGRRRHLLADPRRTSPAQWPAVAAAVASGAAGSPRELAAFARWAARATRADVAELFGARDEPWGESLDEAGVDGRLRRRVLDPFLAGVLGEGVGSTSRQFTELLVRSFVRGRPGVPWRGMQAISDQLAAGLLVVTGVAAESVSARAVRTQAGEIAARAVVVAVDPPTATRLTSLPPVPTHALTTFWHVASEPPTRSPALHVDGLRRGPVVNSVVISNAAPSYSPDGRALIASTVLGSRPDAASEQTVLAQLAVLYGTSTAGWQLLRCHAIDVALPAAAPPLRPRQPVTVGDVVVAGDHRDTPSLQGALVSGRRAADAVLTRLGHPVPPPRTGQPGESALGSRPSATAPAA
jgi:glycine/D-amino acid oxidase-like deaminating enzyme